MRLPTLLLSAVAAATLASCGDGPAEVHDAGIYSGTTLASSLNPAHVGDTITFTANILTEGTPVGLMTFWIAGTPITGCNAIAVTGTTMTCRTAALPLGTHYIQATFNGHQRYQGSASPFIAQVIN